MVSAYFVLHSKSTSTQLHLHLQAMEDSFFFALLRISVAQILKSAGFDKCKPLVLNTVTDIYIKHLELVLSSAKKFALARSSCVNELKPQDIMQALLDVQLVKPLGFESSLSFSDPATEYNTKSLESFIQWLKYSDQATLSRKLSEVPTLLMHNLIEKRKIDTSAETDQEKKKRRLRERQEFYNQLKQTDEGNGLVDEFEDDEITSKDKLSWLTYLAEKDLKLGHNLKFINSCIQDSLITVHKNKKFHPMSEDGQSSFEVFRTHLQNSTKNDHVMIHIQEGDDEGAQTVLPTQELTETLPYNLAYSEALTDDSLDQYKVYADSRQDGEDAQLPSGDEAEMEEKPTNGANGKSPAADTNEDNSNEDNGPDTESHQKDDADESADQAGPGAENEGEDGNETKSGDSNDPDETKEQ